MEKLIAAIGTSLITSVLLFAVGAITGVLSISYCLGSFLGVRD
jgi:hypothetical protein